MVKTFTMPLQGTKRLMNCCLECLGTEFNHVRKLYFFQMVPAT
ncbi:hypothetical protein SLEP1_g29108 [Rubroshorea leprosula]|uniref:Uncharacterized protein n=1 Tax=Rubroshorea leprosula TaxID=152421 RepID=A0AAV5K2W9_9ROSI|nr:hypothetical protein SLEP1_g29108 [Rubroshorea leprosula]